MTVPAGKHADVEFQLDVPAATAGSSNAAALSFREVAGLITFTPASEADNHNVTLRVPYYLVPRAMSKVDAKVAPGTKLAPGQTATINLTNAADAPLAGDADFYALGLQDKNDKKGDLKHSPADLRAVGVQSFPNNASGSNQLLVFAVNTWDAWSSPSFNEIDIYLDVDIDGTDDYVVVGADQGLIQTGTSNGRLATAVFSTRSPGNFLDFFATAKTDSGIAELVAQTSRMCRGDNPATPANDPEPCLSSTNPRFSYHAISFGRDGAVDVLEGTAKYNPWNPAIPVGQIRHAAARQRGEPGRLDQRRRVGDDARGRSDDRDARQQERQGRGDADRGQEEVRRLRQACVRARAPLRRGSRRFVTVPPPRGAQSPLSELGVHMLKSHTALASRGRSRGGVRGLVRPGPRRRGLPSPGPRTTSRRSPARSASLHGTAGLQIRFSAFLEEEAEEDEVAPPAPRAPITPPSSSPARSTATSIAPPDVTVNQDTAGAPQNETAIAVDPNNPNRVVAAANDYVTAHLDLHDQRDAVQRARRRLLGHVLLERRRRDLVLHVAPTRSTSAR